jgi:hypothetical protein
VFNLPFKTSTGTNRIPEPGKKKKKQKEQEDGKEGAVGRTICGALKQFLHFFDNKREKENDALPMILSFEVEICRHRWAKQSYQQM